MANNEIWKEIKGFPYYEVSNMGNVRSIDRVVTKKNNVKANIKSIQLTPQISAKGYVCVPLYKNHKIKMARIHRLVAKEFIPNPNNLPQVNHIDGIKTNNCVENLEWCDNRHNQLHAMKLGLINRSKKVTQLSIDGEPIKQWNSILEASKTLHIDNSHIGQVCCGKRKTAGGYKWKCEVAV